MLTALIIGIPLGVRSASKRGRFTDHAFRVFAILGVSMPIFWLGLVNQLIFYGKLEVLPIDGRLDTFLIAPDRVTGLYLVDSLIAGDLEVFWDALKHLILPGVTMAFGILAVVTRMTRTSMLECLNQDYIRTARAKGLRNFRVTYIHALKNAAPPILTVIGLQTGFLLAGDFLAETIFNWPGIGRYGVTAITNMDFPAIMGVTLLISLIYVLVNLFVDIFYTVFDARIRY
jgi:peptide/nickel transport system permease protein